MKLHHSNPHVAGVVGRTDRLDAALGRRYELGVKLLALREQPRLAFAATGARPTGGSRRWANRDGRSRGWAGPAPPSRNRPRSSRSEGGGLGRAPSPVVSKGRVTASRKRVHGLSICHKYLPSTERTVSRPRNANRRRGHLRGSGPSARPGDAGGAEGPLRADGAQVGAA